MKTLDVCVIDALVLHSKYNIPKINIEPELVVASGNALPTAKIMFSNSLCVDEGQCETVADRIKPKKVLVISASGEKHAPIIIKKLLDKKIDTYLLTCNKNSSAAKMLPEKYIETSSIEEPMTYNVSTYLGMILTKTRENPSEILEFIKKIKIPDFRKYKAFYFIVPPEFDVIREMIMTKFDELFSPVISVRAYTSEQSRHAKQVIVSDEEMFISIGFKNELFGHSRFDVPLFKNADYALVISIIYYIIGNIQKQNNPYFFDSIERFKEFQKKLFDQKFFDEKFRRYYIE